VPWHIEDDNPGCDGYAVVKDSDGSIAGCHETLEEAEAQLAVLYASEESNKMSKAKWNFPARIITRFTPIEELILLLGDIELDEGIEPFFWPAEISSDRLDTYFTHMSERTLRNYAADAQAGVSFLDSHDSYKLGFGQSLKGVVEINQGVTRVVADFYTVPGVRFGGQHSYQSTDDFIRAVKTRLARDVSVGFYGGNHICDICGGNFFDTSECPHFPGVEYPIGDQGNETKVCTITIDNARLSEVSAVYDGATPQAMILKAERMALAGKLTPKLAEVLQVKYRIELPEESRAFPGAKVKNSNGENKMELEKSIRELFNLEEDEAVIDYLTSMKEKVEQLRASISGFEKELAELQPLADNGRAYRADLIDEALAEGVRAMGDDFPMETYRGMLEVASLGHIKQIRDALRGQADERLPGGRHTVDDDENEDGAAKSVDLSVPDAAYVVA
jgi:hypothetical protein